MDDLINFFPPECLMTNLSTGAEEIKSTMSESTVEGNDLLEFSDVMDYLPHPEFNLDKKILKSLERAVRMSPENGINCDHCKGNVSGSRYICISCENAPTLCGECLTTRHTNWHITIRKPLVKSHDDDDDGGGGDGNDSNYDLLTGGDDNDDGEEEDAKSDLSFDCRSFLHYDEDEIKQDDDMKGSYTTCSTFDFKDEEIWTLEESDDNDLSSMASSQWDRFSIESMPDCFNLDRPPDLLKTSLVKVPHRIVTSDWNIGSEDRTEVRPEIDDRLIELDDRHHHDDDDDDDGGDGGDDDDEKEDEEEEGLTWVEPPEDPVAPSPLDFEFGFDFQKNVHVDERYESPSVDQEVRECTTSKYVTFKDFDEFQSESDLNGFLKIEDAKKCINGVDGFESGFPLEEEVMFVPANEEEAQFVPANRVEEQFWSANRRERRRAECFERSFHDVRDPFSYSGDSSPHVVDLLAHAAHHVSGVAMRTVDTFKRVFRAFHNDNLQCPIKMESYDWIPPAMKWSGSNAEHPTTSDSIMKALIEMGFADRALNGVLIKKFENDFERIIDYIVAEGYCYTGWV